MNFDIKNTLIIEDIKTYKEHPGIYYDYFKGRKRNNFIGDFLSDLFIGSNLQEPLFNTPAQINQENAFLLTKEILPSYYYEISDKYKERRHCQEFFNCSRESSISNKILNAFMSEYSEKDIDYIIKKISSYYIESNSVHICEYLEYIIKNLFFSTNISFFLNDKNIDTSSKQKICYDLLYDDVDIISLTAKMIIIFAIACKTVKRKDKNDSYPINKIDYQLFSNIITPGLQQGLVNRIESNVDKCDFEKAKEQIERYKEEYGVDSTYYLLLGKLEKKQSKTDLSLKDVAQKHLITSNCGEGFYLAIDCCNDDESKTYCLKESYKLNYPPAIIDYFDELIKNHTIKNQEKAIEQLSNIVNSNSFILSSANLKKSHYLLGVLFKKQHEINLAQEHFTIAAQLGHELAQANLENKKRTELTNSRFVSATNNETCHNICYVNDNLSYSSKTFMNSLPEKQWVLKVPSVLSIKDFVDSINISNKYIMTFFSENTDKNLEECLLTLDLLFNKALDFTNDEERNKLSICVDLHLKTDDYQYSSALIDASISSMNGIYFKVHIIDSSLINARNLLLKKPLFSPLLENSSQEDVTISLIGSQNYTLLKEILAINQLDAFNDKKLKVSFLSENFDMIEGKFKNECPGVYDNCESYYCIKPTFNKCSFGSLDFVSLFEDKQPDYIVVDTGDDKLNLKVAMHLRANLLRNNLEDKKSPLICIHVESENNTYLAKRLTVDNKVQGDSYFNNYNFYFFGYDLYKYNSLVDTKISRQAFAIHKSYCVDQDENEIANDFWSYSYNRDSSTATAVGLSYRLFAAGLYSDTIDDINKLNELKDKFDKFISSKTKLDQLNALEQSRWNGYMISRGWESATIEDVKEYQSLITNSNHKYALAKLHPFIASWNEIVSKKGETKYKLLKREFPKTKSPKETTEDSIKNTISFIEAGITLEEPIIEIER